jgi:hypothetical protein
MTLSPAATFAGALLVLTAAPAMAQSNIGMFGGRAGGGMGMGGHGGGTARAAHAIPGAGAAAHAVTGAPAAVHAFGTGRGGRFGPGGFGRNGRRFAHDGHGNGNGNGDVFIAGWGGWGGWGWGYDYPWYAGPADYGYDASNADAPPAPPAMPPSGYHYYDRHERHDSGACAEWSWASAKQKYVCTRRAS